jgi:hypothetical protein
VSSGDPGCASPKSPDEAVSPRSLASLDTHDLEVDELTDDTATDLVDGS